MHYALGDPVQRGKWGKEREKHKQATVPFFHKIIQWSFSFETGEGVNCTLALAGTLEGALLFWFSGFIQLEASGRAEHKALGMNFLKLK